MGEWENVGSLLARGRREDGRYMGLHSVALVSYKRIFYELIYLGISDEICICKQENSLAEKLFPHQIS